MRILKKFDPWRSPLCPCPRKYTLNPYTGCGFKCIYCYITSYIKDPFNPRPKKDLLKNLKRDLDSYKGRLRIAIAYSTDPYTYPEAEYKLTRRILELLAKYDVEVLIATKSTLISRDIDLLKRLNAVVSITITTLDDETARLIEPNVPRPSARLRVVEKLIKNGIKVSLRIDPVIPYITDDLNMIKKLIKLAYDMGVSHIVSSIYKAKPDSFRRVLDVFPDKKGDLMRLYTEYGIQVYGYRYPPYSYRYKILKYIRDNTLKYNLTFNTCREGMRYLDTPNSYCDASHLL